MTTRSTSRTPSSPLSSRRSCRSSPIGPAGASTHGGRPPGLPERPRRRLDTWGTDHVIYRLGEDLSVRLPKIDWAAEQGERERRWLPVLASHLPVQVPTPVFVGTPAYGYPYAWYVAPWIEGANPRPGEE